MFATLDHSATARVATISDQLDAELDTLEGCPPDAWTLEMLEALDPAMLTDTQRVRVLVLAQRVAAHVQAIGLRAAAAVSSLDGPDDWAQEEVSCALAVSGFAADQLLTTARALGGRLSHTGAALDAGLLSYAKAVTLATRTAHLGDPAAVEVEATVLPVAAEQTPGRFIQSVKTAVINTDPAEADRRARHARRHADVRLRPGDDAMSQLVIDLPAVEGVAAWQLIDGLAGPGHPEDPRLVGERRVDAFLHLINSRYDTGHLPTRHGRPITVGVTMTLETALGLSEQAADLHGYGPIPPAVARQLAAQGTWRAWIADATTAHLIALGTTAYRPDQATSDFVTARDATCVFPYCDIPASRCDLDHVIPYDQGGKTEPINLALENRRHHRAKHGPWQLTRAPDGTNTWTSPLGFTYTTRPPAQPLDP